MKLTPAMCDGVAYEGSLEMRAPSFDERIELFEEVDLEEGADQKKQSLKIMKVVAKKSHLFVTNVNIKRLSDGFVFDTWDAVYHDSDMVPLIMEVCGKILGKFQAGPVA